MRVLLCLAAMAALAAAAQPSQQQGQLTNMVAPGSAGSSGSSGKDAAGGFDDDRVDERTGAHLDALKQYLKQQKASVKDLPLEDMAKETYKPEIRTWNYANGGLEWEEGLCAVGKQQSPILLDPAAVNATHAVGGADAAHYLMRFNYTHHDGMSMIFNGHTLAVTGDLGWVETGCCHKRRYEVLSFHFHAPAGHTVRRGNATWRAPLELRVVHQDVAAKGKDGLMMISVFFDVDPKRKDAPNKFLEQVDWDEAPERIGVKHHIAQGVDLALLREQYNGDFMAYNGSLATPTCDEGVEWRVMDNIAHLSQHQVNKVHGLLVRRQSTAQQTSARGNYRNTQPRNGRAVVHYHRAHDSCHTTAKPAGNCCQRHCCATKANPCAAPSTSFPAHPGFVMP